MPLGRVQTKIGTPGTPKKDAWDKITTLTPAMITLILGVLGWHATDTYNTTSLAQQESQARNTLELQRSQAAAALAQQKAQADATNVLAQTQALDHLFEYIASSDPRKRLFGYTMYAHLGNEELAAKLIALNLDSAGKPLLETLRDNSNQAVSAAARQGLDRLENVRGNLADRASCKLFAESGFKVATRQSATADDIKSAAAEMDIEPAVLMAVVKVMSNSSALPDGRQRILFERHIFSRLTDHQYDADHGDISSTTPGGYGPAGAAQYERLTAAAALNCPAALEATSWGAYQILGLNYATAGYAHPDDYIKDVLSSGQKELQAAVTFFKNSGIIPAMRDKDWPTVARKWVGPNFAHYAALLQAAYQDATAMVATETKP